MNEPAAGMRQSYALLNDLRFHYFSWQPDDPGPSAVLLHGLASNARIWHKVGPLLSQHGYEVYAPDQRGHGLTDKPSSEYDFEAISRDLAAGINYWHLQQPILVGHSWGASVCLEYAARHPFGPLAPAAVVLVDGGLIGLQDGPEGDWESVRERLKPPALSGMPVEQFIERLRKGLPGWEPDETSVQAILANFVVDEEETISPQLSLENHLAILHSLWEYQPLAALRRVNCPVLAVLAQPPGNEPNEFLERKQRAVPQAVQARPDLQVLWMPDSIHDLPLQRPQELVRAILDFTAPR
jgi:pimeloyl-ACP methyl ester carboxylesterase